MKQVFGQAVRKITVYRCIDCIHYPAHLPRAECPVRGGVTERQTRACVDGRLK